MDTLKQIFQGTRSKSQSAAVEDHPNFWMYY